MCILFCWGFRVSCSCLMWGLRGQLQDLNLDCYGAKHSKQGATASCCRHVEFSHMDPYGTAISGVNGNYKLGCLHAYIQKRGRDPMSGWSLEWSLVLVLLQAASVCSWFCKVNTWMCVTCVQQLVLYYAPVCWSHSPATAEHVLPTHIGQQALPMS